MLTLVDPSAVREWLRASGADSRARAGRIAQCGVALVAPLVAIASDWAEPLDQRERAIDALGEVTGGAGLPFDGLWALLEDPRFTASERITDDETGLMRRIGRALASVVRNDRSSMDRVTAGLSAGCFSTEYASAIALESILHTRSLSPSELSLAVAAITERISPRNWFETEMYEACFDALGAAGPAAGPAIAVLVDALGLEVSGDRAAIALSQMGEAGHRALIGALATLAPARGGWSPADWDVREPRYNLALFVGDIGPAVVPMLIDALSGEHRELRYFAGRALEHMVASQPPARARVAAHERTLIAALADTDELSGSFHPCVSLLQDVGTQQALPALDAMAAEGWPEAQAAADSIRAR